MLSRDESAQFYQNDEHVESAERINLIDYQTVSHQSNKQTKKGKGFMH